MEPRLLEIEPKMLIGLHLTMTLAEDKTEHLWRSLAPRLGEINRRASTDLISLQIYPPNWTFQPDQKFIKWAAVEVTSHDDLPHDLDAFLMTGGLYAVFTHHGPAASAVRIFSRIFQDWMPDSPYEQDDREHFEVLPQNYDPRDPKAREEIWIPVRNRSTVDDPDRLDTDQSSA